MATAITYTAKQKENLFDAGWKGSGKGAGSSRAIKMLRPECSVCQIGGDELVGWWNECEHDPYWALRPKTMRVPVYVKDEDGDMVLDEDATRQKSRTKFIRLPNIVEIQIQTQSNSGIAPQKFATRKGFKPVTEEGIAPICECYGCGKSYPTVRTDFGDYCSVRHAKLCIASESGIFLTVYTDDAAKQKKIQQKEMQDIVI